MYIDSIYNLLSNDNYIPYNVNVIIVLSANENIEYQSYLTELSSFGINRLGLQNYIYDLIMTINIFSIRI